MGEFGIDPFSENSLYDVLGKDLDPGVGNGTEYFGFHIIPQGDGHYHVQYDGHAGSVMDFHRDDYNDVLELVSDLTDLIIRVGDLHHRNDKDALVEWAGKMITYDSGKAEEKPELYIHVPNDQLES